MLLKERLLQYVYLMRLDKPIGIFLLLWPTLWALWLAGKGSPDIRIVVVFVLGVVLMRSAGCVVNDVADRNIDGHVDRTKNRPLPRGSIAVKEAILLAALLSLFAFLLVIFFCNSLTVKLAIVGACFALTYPFLKRMTQLPQLGLGIAFTWGVPMAFAALKGQVGTQGWFLFFSGMIWPVIYDTMYAMVDRKDDEKIGVKSSAIFFGTMDVIVIALMQILFLIMMWVVGIMFLLHPIYYICVALVGLLFIYQQWLIRDDEPKQCFYAFRNNNWVGLVLFLGIVLSFTI